MRVRYPPPATIVFEAVRHCSHACERCSNVWKQDSSYPSGRLSTADTIRMLPGVLEETAARLLTVSGGEPMLRQDLFDILNAVAERGAQINPISSGLLLDEAAIASLPTRNMGFVELPLLPAQRAVHDRMSGREGAFDRATRAVGHGKAAGLRVVAVIVAARGNIEGRQGAAELAVALGVGGIVFDRFNPVGAGVSRVGELQADPENLQRALDVADQICRRYGLPISCSMAMPPRLIDIERYPSLGVGSFAAGTECAYCAVDPLGNVRPCNRSRTVLGNALERSFYEILASDAMGEFARARPEFCAGCALERTRSGGCKAAAEICRGSPWEMDPSLSASAERAPPDRRRCWRRVLPGQ
jgi:radical SAM protein with 4Fe4S-binding SPASM domain